MADRTRRYLAKSLTDSDLRLIAAALHEAGRDAQVNLAIGQLTSADTIMSVSLGHAYFDNPVLYPPGRKVLGAHMIETGADMKLDRLVDEAFRQLVEAGDAKAHCSHCYAHTVREENRLIVTRTSLSCDLSLQLNDPGLYQFLSTATKQELQAAVDTHNLVLPIPEGVY